MASEDHMDDEPESVSDGMLQHPVFVYWCVSCGQEASEDVITCPRCSSRVERHQRVIELPDPPDARAEPFDSQSRGGEGLASLRSLRAALADVAVGAGIGDAAVLLFEQGADADVAASHPELSRSLAALGVPPAVQRALVSQGIVKWEQIQEAMSNTKSVNALASELGVSSPAAEVLLRRLCNAANERWHVSSPSRRDRSSSKRHRGERPQSCTSSKRAGS
eukprot:TRINITY_DN21233_c0_g2_i3.p1 TRINITY_DN21233_c0_g2~~TRINITY_DN21233_c0_g2_i3.p1  ORF type:complete len:221 (-),score=32.43 TRINITY_DN21233_c0_g2_i3:549-1211(-)